MIDLEPTHQEIRAERERSGDGITVCRKRLRLKRMQLALSFVESTPATDVMLAVLITLVAMEQGNV